VLIFLNFSRMKRFSLYMCGGVDGHTTALRLITGLKQGLCTVTDEGQQSAKTQYVAGIKPGPHNTFRQRRGRLMRNTRPKKKHSVIDKSILAFGCKVRLRAKAYTDSYRGATCIIPDCPEDPDTVVGAHIRKGWFGQSKPHDYLTLPLCGKHHALQGKIGEERFWMENKGWTIKQAKEVARQRYEVWKNG
jgi:hypothetical protein